MLASAPWWAGLSKYHEGGKENVPRPVSTQFLISGGGVVAPRALSALVFEFADVSQLFLIFLQGTEEEMGLFCIVRGGQHCFRGRSGSSEILRPHILRDGSEHTRVADIRPCDLAGSPSASSPSTAFRFCCLPLPLPCAL